MSEGPGEGLYYKTFKICLFGFKVRAFCTREVLAGFEAMTFQLSLSMLESYLHYKEPHFTIRSRVLVGGYYLE